METCKCGLPRYRRKLCIFHYEKRIHSERASYQKHRKKKIQQTLRWIAAHREHVNREQNRRARARYRSNPEFRAKVLAHSKIQYRKHIARYTLRNIRQCRTEKQRARMALHYAVRIGKLIRPSQCDSCNKTCKPHGHHHKGYKEPLNVIWLCTLCHGEIHQIK